MNAASRSSRVKFASCPAQVLHQAEKLATRSKYLRSFTCPTTFADKVPTLRLSFRLASRPASPRMRLRGMSKLAARPVGRVVRGTDVGVEWEREAGEDSGVHSA